MQGTKKKNVGGRKLKGMNSAEILYAHYHEKLAEEGGMMNIFGSYLDSREHIDESDFHKILNLLRAEGLVYY